MSTWNYRIVKVEAAGEEPAFGLYEVFYSDEGVPVSRTLDPITFVAESQEDVQIMLRQAFADAFRLDVLPDSEIKVSDSDW